jgi:hypothetical protein
MNKMLNIYSAIIVIVIMVFAYQFFTGKIYLKSNNDMSFAY